MEPFYPYLLKSSFAMAVFYLLYIAVLKKDTFLRLRRWYFLSAMFFALVYPLITIDAWANVADIRSVFGSAKAPAGAAVAVGMGTSGFIADESAPEFAFSWQSLVGWIYATVTVFLTLRFVWQLLSIFRIKTRSKKQIIYQYVVYHIDREITPFSFFNWIFLNTQLHEEEELNQILIHERVHAAHNHSFDIVLAEILCILFWWNPFVWLIKREMTINLEYLADKGVLNHGISSRDYQYHLLRLSYNQPASQIVNNFNVSQLKQRIMMMNKAKSPTPKSAKYLIAIPLALFLMAFNSCINGEKKSTAPPEVAAASSDTITSFLPAVGAETTRSQEEVFMVVEEQPLFPGGNEAMMKFLSDNIKYPSEAQQKGIQGRVITNFVVEKDGSITDVQIIRSVAPSLDKEAVRVVQSMPRWIPGKQRGETVRVRYTLPVVYRLQGNDAKTVPPPPSSPPAYTKTKEELKSSDEVFVAVESQPEFPGGNEAMMKFLGDNIKYPLEAQQKGIQGRVITNFVVEKDGSITDVQIIRSVAPSLDKEAVRVVQSMPRWIPGKQRGETVRVRYTLPVVYRLQQ